MISKDDSSSLFFSGESSSAPVMEEIISSAPPLSLESSELCSEVSASAPPVYSDLSDQLSYLHPHNTVSQQLQSMHPHQMLHQEKIQDVMREESEEPEIVPFTDSQLHALYHNVELEKNVEFVDHWLETQKHVEKFQLDEMLLNYLRVRTVLCSSRRKYDTDRDEVKLYEQRLWIMSTDR